MATTPTCQFCGGEHPEQELTFLGLTVAIRPCPNMPTTWVAIGPDAEGDLTILDVQTGPLADPRFRDAGPPERFGDE